MAAPGAVIISKILIPSSDDIDTNVEVTKEKIGSNVLDAISNGTVEGLKLAVNVASMLLVFIAFLAMGNFILSKNGSFTGLNSILYIVLVMASLKNFITSYIRLYICSINVGFGCM